MIDPGEFLDALSSRGIRFFSGVPDSLLGPLCSGIEEAGRRGAAVHVKAANEGNAVGHAIGYHLGCGKAAAVYMQNSGLGNAVNPLVSLAHPDVYKVPMLLIIGWRGEPGVKDEPQHVHQGRITKEQLGILGIPFEVLDADCDWPQRVERMIEVMVASNAPVALLVRKDTFAAHSPTLEEPPRGLSSLSREAAIGRILSLASPTDLILSTTGKASREVFEYRVARREPPNDFLTVGGMGHTASIALGVSITQPHRRIVCLDGDGSVLMHMGCLPSIPAARPPRFLHVLLNNGAHESVGGQATVAPGIDFGAVARGCGYKSFEQADSLHSLDRAWSALCAEDSGAQLLEIRLACGARSDLGRPTTTPEFNKQSFMRVAGHAG